MPQIQYSGGNGQKSSMFKNNHEYIEKAQMKNKKKKSLNLQIDLLYLSTQEDQFCYNLIEKKPRVHK